MKVIINLVFLDLGERKLSDPSKSFLNICFGDLILARNLHSWNKSHSAFSSFSLYMLSLSSLLSSWIRDSRFKSSKVFEYHLFVRFIKIRVIIRIALKYNAITVVLLKVILSSLNIAKMLYAINMKNEIPKIIYADFVHLNMFLFKIRIAKKISGIAVATSKIAYVVLCSQSSSLWSIISSVSQASQKMTPRMTEIQKNVTKIILTVIRQLVLKILRALVFLHLYLILNTFPSTQKITIVLMTSVIEYAQPSRNVKSLKLVVTSKSISYKANINTM